ncbi:MAG: hypothetical protein HUJ68_01670 [Clostridia bacterium]|nr:hypothetical protein [Clostridia bacterium]
MKTGKIAKDRKSQNILSYDGVLYTYDSFYNFLKNHNFKKIGKDVDYDILVVSYNGKSVPLLIFQDSRTEEDWKTNFSFIPHPTKAYKGWKNKLWYHKGFYTAYQSARDEIISELKKSIEETKSDYVIVAGWSYGASISQIAVEDIYFHFGLKSTWIGYEGAHPCSTLHTRKVVQSCMKDDSIHFVYGGDIVPRCPPFPFGWKIKDFIYFIPSLKEPRWLCCGIRTLIDYFKTEHYHCNVDIGIKGSMKN